MQPPSFIAPGLETLNGFLPAFEFTALIASNDHSAVYLAKQRSLERDVAIKMLSPHVSEASEFRQLFETTARTMARLNHPNLIGVFDSGFVEGMLYFVMEFVPGKSLEHSSRGQRVEAAQALALVEGISDGLSHAHAHDIVHGNLNPSNILLNQKAEAKISNFGFTHPVDEGEDHDTFQAGPYTAPELVARHAQATRKSDIYAVGSILYELLTGQAHSPQAKPPSVLSGCNPGLDAIWKQATHPDPAARYPDMRAFRTALTDLLKIQRPPIIGPPSSQRLGVQGAPPSSQRLGVQGTPPSSQRLGAQGTPPSSQRLGAQGSPPSSQRLGPRKAGGAGAPPARIPAASKSSGISFGVILNLFLLAGLMVATYIVWKKVEQKRALEQHPEPKVDESLVREREQAEERLRQSEQDRLNGKKHPADSTHTIPHTPESKSETAEESLSRLRDTLASGNRGEMPVGSIHQGNSDYFLVKDSMTWPEAAWFAEQHGAHLAIPNAAADLTWLVRNLSSGDGIWIGAARNGGVDWALADGTVWKPKKEPTGRGMYLAADKNGSLQAEPLGKRHAFVIQWRSDGSNPGALSALLATTRASVAAGTPAYPPGTQLFENRHYLMVSRTLPWREAVDLAEKSGGHLAVASEANEATSLAQAVTGLTASDGLWLGGFRKGEQWVWITGEPWKSASWTKDAATENADTALVLRPGSGWDTRDLSENAAGFIIEWSNDRASKPNSAPTSSNLEVTTLTTRAKDLITAADRKRTEKLAANSTKMGWDFDILLRNLPKSDQAIWGEHIDRLKKSVSNNRVPVAVPRSSGIRLSPKMAQIAENAAKQQQQIDADFLAESEKIRTAYLAKIKDALSAAEKAGQRSLAQSIGTAVADASNLNEWLRSMEVDPNPRTPSLAEPEDGAKKSSGDGQNRPPRDGGGKGPLVE